MATIRYVNTASSAGGNGTTNATAGANRAYPTLAAWNTAEAADITAVSGGHIVYCSGGQDAIGGTSINTSGWTTDSTHVLQIVGHPAALAGTSGNGKNDTNAFSTSYYYLEVTSTGQFIQQARYVTIDGIQFKLSASTGGGSGIVQINTNNGVSTTLTIIQNCRFDTHLGTGARCVTNTGAAPIVRVVNCTFRMGGNFSDRALFWQTGQVADMYNCTVDGGGSNFTNFEGNPTAETVKNSVSINCGDDFYQITTIAYCASTAGDGSNAVTIANATAWNLAMLDYANGDYSVKNATSLLYGAGLAGGLAPTTDINGVTRKSPPDIGAFELGSSAIPGPIRGLCLSNFGYR